MSDYGINKIQHVVSGGLNAVKSDQLAKTASSPSVIARATYLESYSKTPWELFDQVNMGLLLAMDMCLLPMGLLLFPVASHPHHQIH